METLIDHAILLHDRVEKDSLFFVGFPADTGFKQQQQQQQQQLQQSQRGGDTDDFGT
ncbi:hypothetical protein [Brevibacterium zhoupengii]|uniref:hypothetical protein n=1 Tax=Brevibacterium zhoupengii TaxID=2898795 RepID=UPI001E43FC24|nr:hypothetical protein [Brevibacterium zhoupengii]